MPWSCNMIHLYAISCGKEIQGYLNVLVINSIPHPGVQLYYRLLQMPQQSLCMLTWCSASLFWNGSKNNIFSLVDIICFYLLAYIDKHFPWDSWGCHSTSHLCSPLDAEWSPHPGCLWALGGEVAEEEIPAPQWHAVCPRHGERGDKGKERHWLHFVSELRTLPY